MNTLPTRFTITDSFFGRYQTLIRETVIPYQEKMLHDEIPDAEKSHAIENFKQAAQMLQKGHCDGEFYGMVFQDSDVAKWLEAAAYSLASSPDSDLEARCDQLIDLIGSAQHPDGYLNTFFTVKEPTKRWTNLAEAHELYCAGHMMEAAVAYAQSTGKTKLLAIMSKMTDHIYEHFITEQAEGYPGHPEVELALMRMYHATSEPKYLELARHFINTRGEDPDFYRKEAKKRDWYVWGPVPAAPDYMQTHAPVRQQDKAVGHAVRAVYLYTGMADLAATTGDTSLKVACETLWNNIVNARMYVTGAIGSAYEGEAFTKDYHLPNDTAYAETCASIGLIFFAQKMLELEKKGEYGDVMERALYNCVLAGMQLDGQRFFYVNPLEVIPGISGEAVTHRHALPQRPKWFGCACCPPNVARLLSSIEKYAWTIEDTTIYSNLYIGGTLDVSDQCNGKIKVTTSYPYDNVVHYHFLPNEETMHTTLAIRMPNWSKNTRICLNGKEVIADVKEGFAYLTGSYLNSDVVTVTFAMEPQTIFASDAVSADHGKVAFLRGPLVYCLEGIDHQEELLHIKVKKGAVPTVNTYHPEQLQGITTLTVDGYRVTKQDTLYSFQRPTAEPVKLTLLPYYAWGNRGITQMRVWIPEVE